MKSRQTAIKRHFLNLRTSNRPSIFVEYSWDTVMSVGSFSAVPDCSWDVDKKFRGSLQLGLRDSQCELASDGTLLTSKNKIVPSTEPLPSGGCEKVHESKLKYWTADELNHRLFWRGICQSVPKTIQISMRKRILEDFFWRISNFFSFVSNLVSYIYSNRGRLLMRIQLERFRMRWHQYWQHARHPWYAYLRLASLPWNALFHSFLNWNEVEKQ